ncbi:MAG: polysaccharide lyase 6 family protein [Prolixibacteraceae bacterium]
MKLITSMVVVLTLLLVLNSCNNKNQKLVNSMLEFNQAVTNAEPGDIIVLANGTWNDTELNFKGKGTQELPIQLTAQTKGKVFLEGQSNLRISGEHLIVSGLVFRNGSSPTGTVIQFREDKDIYAYNCRLTECVIDNYNGMERFDTESWIDLYGQNNRVDHCAFVGKRNRGVTLTVRLRDEKCINNNHQIDHNYFGYRQSLGSNGGETIRIGTSHYSLSTSGTIVEANYFDRCDGEVEIISNKSCGNKYINNTFNKCCGTLTFRHGHDNDAIGNFFYGDYKANTGGLRIINERNKAINNYFYGITGYRFRSALAILNGVPNSPINRYNQVIGGVVSNNTFIDCDNIQLCAGSDTERSAVPIETVIENNIFYHKQKENIFTVFDDISGISFSNNLVNKNISAEFKTGFSSENIELSKNEAGFVVPVNIPDGIGSELGAPVARLENTGVSWYAIPEQELFFGFGKQIEVQPGLNTLYDAVQASSAGDVIQLVEGEYENTKKITCDHSITIQGKNQKSMLFSEQSSMFVIENGGALRLVDLSLSGSQAPDMTGNAIVSTSKYSMNRNYKLFVENCVVKDLKVNNSFNFLKSAKNTMADSIFIRNTTFTDVSGDILSLNHETEDLGIYNAEFVDLVNSKFENIEGAVLNLYRGGTDESTVGPWLNMKDCSLKNTGLGSKNKSKSFLSIHGVQNTKIENNSFQNCGDILLYHTNGEPQTIINNNVFYPEINIKANTKEYEAEGNKIEKL